MEFAVLLLTIVVGICTGIASNTISWFFVTVLLPWYQDFTYQGVRLDGTWSLVQPQTAADGGPLSTAWALSVTLKQRAYRIFGHATAIQADEGKTHDIINYVVVGHIRDRFVTVDFRNTDRCRIAYSSFLLEVVGDGGEMRGYRAFYGHRKKIVRSIESFWLRCFNDPSSKATCRTT